MSRNPWALHNSVFDTESDEPYIGRRPSDEVVRTATRKYIVSDFSQKGKNYSPEDYDRVRNYLTETSPLNTKAR